LTVLIWTGGGLGGELTQCEGREVVGGRRWLERKTEDILRRAVGRGSDWREIVRRHCIGNCRGNIVVRRRKILIRRGDRSGEGIGTGNCLHDGTWQV
jgi:hypothetical protein